MNYHHHHRVDRHWTQYDSPMCRAFLDALVRWAAAHHDDETAHTVLPTGTVTAAELVSVLRALERAKGGRHVR